MPLKDDDIKQLIAILQRGLSSDEQSSETQPTKTVKAKRRKTKEVIVHQTDEETDTKPKRINKFDKMAEKDMHKSDSKIDQLLCVHPPTIRTREFEPIEVRCRVCQRLESINPALLHDSPDRYKCNRCSGAPG
jgi:rubrerythrin